MYHIIPLMPEEMALLASVMDGDCADIAAIASCTPYGDDGLAVLCLEEQERKRAFGCLHRAMSARQAVWTILSASAVKVLAEVSKRVGPGTVEADPEVLAARQATPDVGTWTPLVRLEKYEGPIYEQVLARRLAQAHGFKHTGTAIQLIVQSATDPTLARSSDDGSTIIWPKQADPHAPVDFRRAPPGKRYHNDVPMPELAGLARAFLSRGISPEEAAQHMRDE